MAKDELIQELLRTLKAPQINFNKGLSEFDLDNENGFCSDLSNMDIENGVVKRRLGTRCLNDPDVQVDVKLIHSSRISGCPVGFIITEDRQILAFLNEFPEYLMSVAKRGFVPLSTDARYLNIEEDQTNGDKKWTAWFYRGNNYFVAEDMYRIRFINDFGDTFTINKNGYIQITSAIRSPKQINIRNDIELARRKSPEKLYLMVEIEDTTLRTAPKFFIIEDTKKKSIPIKDIVKIGIVNNEGVVAPLTSNESILVEHRNCFISLVDCKPVSGTFECRGIAYQAEPDFTGSYLKRTAEFVQQDSEIIIEAQNESIYIDSSPITNEAGTIQEVYAMAWQAPSSPKRLYVWFDGASGVSTASDAPGVPSGSFVECTSIELLNEATISISSGAIEDASFTPLGQNYCPTPLVTKVIAVSDSAAHVGGIPITYAWDSGTKTLSSVTQYTGIVYALDIDTDKTIPGLSFTFDMKTGLSPSSFPFPTSTYPLNIYRLKLKMLVKTSGGLSFPNNGFKYDVPSGTGLLLKNKGFDCWSMNYTNDIRAYYSSLYFNNITRRITLDNEYDVAITGSENLFQFNDWLIHGNRFAVYNDKNIIAVSQMAYVDKENINVYGDFIYDIAR